MEWQNSAVVVPSTETEGVPSLWPTHDHEIGMTEAREVIGRWRRQNPSQKNAGAFKREALDRLLAQKGCMGVRMYYGLDKEGFATLVLVGVDEYGNDMDEGELFDRAVPCPPACTMDSALDM